MLLLYLFLFLLIVSSGLLRYKQLQEKRKQLALAKRARLAPYHVTDNMVKRHKLIISLGRALEPDTILPNYFKWKERILLPVRDQGKCASCWSFAVAECVGNRVAVQTGGFFKDHLSAQELMSCFMPSLFSCASGGLPELAYNYVVHHGLSKENDYPYTLLKGGLSPDCKVESSFLESFWTNPNRHENNKSKIFGKEGTAINLCYNVSGLKQGSEEYNKKLRRNIRNMKAEIYSHGPICGTLYVKKDLYKYSGESIYRSSPNLRVLGGHAIIIVGWCNAGINTDEPGFQDAYWICINSWSNRWPLNIPKEHGGFFYVAMGINESGIESRASAVQPLLTSELKQMRVSREMASYSTYTDYVNDEERVNFFGVLKERRRATRHTA